MLIGSKRACWKTEAHKETMTLCSIARCLQIKPTNSLLKNSVLVVSNSEASEANGGKNYLRVSNIGFGFQAVSEAENLEISSGKKFVLVGSSHAGFSHNKGDLTDEQVFDTGHKLLTSSSNGGSIAVKENSELYFGTEFLDG